MHRLLTTLILVLGLPLLALAQGTETSSRLDNLSPLPESPVDWSHLDNLSVAPRTLLRGATTYPAQFDLRDYNQVTPVRDQQDSGLCWSFATMAGLESTHAVSDAVMTDLSEAHLGYYAYVDVDSERIAFDADGPTDTTFEILELGGNLDQSAAMLIRGTGAVSETDAPFENKTTPVPDAASPNALLLSRVYALPKGVTFEDNVKYALTHFGAVSIPVTFASPYYNEAESAFYVPSYDPANHAVLIVGWDDSFSRTRFATQPPGDGAWIVKNSWGESWGDAGYNYVSYHDATLNDADGNAYVFVGMEPDAYDVIHTHTPLWETHKTGYGYENYMANVFTADAAETLGAVGFQVPDLNTTYTLQVYLDPDASPVDGTLAYSASGTVDLPGYATIDLTQAVAVAAGQKFSVVMHLTTTNTTLGISIESPSPDFSSKASSGPRESYFSADGVNWEDLKYTSGYENDNVCLVAYANATGSTPSLTPVYQLLLFE